MLEATTRILMLKYDPTNALLQWVNQPQTGHVEKHASSISPAIIVGGGRKFIVLMSSADYTDKQIFEVCTAYNKKHPKYKSYSYQLPVSMFGIPADSWVFVLPEREPQ